MLKKPNNIPAQEWPIEPLPEISVPLETGASVMLWAATKEESLVWKLLWLITDTYAQGKDLYDAVLLAEDTSLSPAFATKFTTYLGQTFRYCQGVPLKTLIEDIKIDWKDFNNDYPWVEGEVSEWHQRLKVALGIAEKSV